MERLTPNQLIAWNLREARREAGEREGLGRPLTQEEAADRLEPFLGVRWSRTTFSAAEEGSISGRRIRQFSADDVVAFARAFDLPIGWFFLPVPRGEYKDDYQVANEGSSKELSPMELLDLAFAEARMERLSRRLTKLGLPLEQLSKSETQLADLGRGLLSAGLESQIGSLATLADQLANAEKAIRFLAEGDAPREKTGAELITEAIESMGEYPTPMEYEGEIGQRRAGHEVAEAVRGGIAHNVELHRILTARNEELRSFAKDSPEGLAMIDGWQRFLDESLGSPSATAGDAEAEGDTA
ncbi:MAG: hypothetical protein GEU71_04695 [Actinobacteria bacterium]|nr:hypothetical protein [Actinomycetota bacterium]